jgi:hypothetical protein
VQQIRVFAGEALVDVATKPQVAGLCVVADCRHHWAKIVGQNLIVAHKGSDHAACKNYCNLGVGRGGRLFNICV